MNDNSTVNIYLSGAATEQDAQRVAKAVDERRDKGRSAYNYIPS